MCDDYVDNVDECELILDEHVEDEAIRLFGPRVEGILSSLDDSVYDECRDEIADGIKYQSHKPGKRFCLCDLREAIAGVLIGRFGGVE